MVKPWETVGLREKKKKLGSSSIGTPFSNLFQLILLMSGSISFFTVNVGQSVNAMPASSHSAQAASRDPVNGPSNDPAPRMAKPWETAGLQATSRDPAKDHLALCLMKSWEAAGLCEKKKKIRVIKHFFYFYYCK